VLAKVRSTSRTFLACGGLVNCLGLLAVVLTVVVHCWRVFAYAVDAAIRMGLSRHLGVICLRVVMSSLLLMCWE